MKNYSGHNFRDVRWFDVDDPSSTVLTSKEVKNSTPQLAQNAQGVIQKLKNYLSTRGSFMPVLDPNRPLTWLDTDLISFQNEKEKYGEFSNYSPHPVTIDGVEYKTTEHYFQAQKFTNNSLLFQQVRNAPSPGEAKDIAWKKTNQKRSVWDDVSITIMEKAIRTKFAQGTPLAEILKGTYPKILVELPSHSVGYMDNFWGAWTDKNNPQNNPIGQNHLGRILMHVRAELLGKISPNTPYSGKGDDDKRIQDIIKNYREWAHSDLVRVSVLPPETIKQLKQFDQDLAVLRDVARQN